MKKGTHPSPHMPPHQAHRYRPIIPRIPTPTRIIPHHPNMSLRHDRMFCRRRLLTCRIDAHNVAGKAEDAFADDAGGVEWGVKGYHGAAVKGGGAVTEEGETVFEDEFAVSGHCG